VFVIAGSRSSSVSDHELPPSHNKQVTFAELTLFIVKPLKNKIKKLLGQLLLNEAL